MQKALFGAGSFWGVEFAFKQIPGIAKITVGYSGGFTNNPNHSDVSSGETGHVEVALLEFNEEKISYEQLVKIFFSIHNPTLLNEQGAFKGNQFRSVIFYYNDSQKEIAQNTMDDLENSDAYEESITTKIEKYTNFFAADELHQNYLEKGGDPTKH